MWKSENHYRTLAAEWHGGQGSALYAFSSSGAILPGGELEASRAADAAEAAGALELELTEARELGEYLAHRFAALEESARELGRGATVIRCFARPGYYVVSELGRTPHEARVAGPFGRFADAARALLAAGGDPDTLKVCLEPDRRGGEGP